MSANTSISWTDATWNPVRGCTKISAGCKNCYAERFAERWRGIPGHPFEQGFDVRLVPDALELPLKWKKPRRIFVNSVSDLFHKDVPFEYIERVWDSMFDASWHTYQILTKRAKRMLEFAEWMRDTRHRRIDYPNVHLGVSVENQAAAEDRIQYLLQVPAAVRFISGEPLLGPVDLNRIRAPGTPEHSPLHFSALHESHDDCFFSAPGVVSWVIVGGESGPGARPMHPDWARNLRDQCQAAGVPFHFKQWGEFRHNGEPSEWAQQTFNRVGKKAAGRDLDGRTWDEFPEGK